MAQPHPGARVGRERVSAAIRGARISRKHVPAGAARIGRERISAAIRATRLGHNCISSGIGAAHVWRERISAAIGAAAGATRTTSACAEGAADATRAATSAASTRVGAHRATSSSRATRARAASSAGAASAASAADGRIGGSAGTRAVTKLASPAGGSRWRGIAGGCAVAGHAAQVAARATFLLGIAARGVGRALAGPTGLVAGHAGVIARALTTHPIHAEPRSAAVRFGTSRAVLALADAAAVARLPAGTGTGDFCAWACLEACAFMAGNGTGLASARTGRDSAAHAVHAETRGAGRRGGGGTPFAVAETSYFVLPDFARLRVVSHPCARGNNATEQHNHAALAVKGRGACPCEARVYACRQSAQVPSWTLGIQFPGFECPRCAGNGHDVPAPQAIVGDQTRPPAALENGDIAAVAQHPAGCDGIPLPESAVAAVVRLVRDEDHLLAVLVEAQRRRKAPGRHNTEG